MYVLVIDRDMCFITWAGIKVIQRMITIGVSVHPCVIQGRGNHVRSTTIPSILLL